MTEYRFRLWSARYLFATAAFSVLAYGTVERWAISTVEILIFLLAAAWAVRWLVSPFRVPGSVYAAPLAIIAGMAALQSWFGWSSYVYETWGGAVLWLAYILFFLLCRNVFDDEVLRRGFLTALVWLGFGLAVLGLVQFYTSPDAVYWLKEAPGAQPFGPFADRNHFAIFIELLLPLALLLAWREPEKRLVYLVLCGLMIASVIVCGSRAGSVAVGAETAVFVIAAGVSGIRSGRASPLAGLLQIGGAAAAAAAFMYAAGFTKLLERFEEIERATNRFEVAGRTWEIFLTKPWTGYGLGTFQQVFQAFSEFHDGFVWNQAHSDPVQLAMELGVAGLAAQALMIGLLAARRRRFEVWLTGVLPLAAAWAHSWVEFPLQMPSLVLTALVLLASVAAPAGVRKNAVKRRRRRRELSEWPLQTEPAAAAKKDLRP